MNEKPVLIYVGDPMCSWCYGVSEEMAKVKIHFKSTHDFEIMMGGLRPYNTQVMTDLKEFLTHHWEEVQSRSGQPFSYDILDNASITYDTEPPCRAVVLVRDIAPDKAFDFFKEIQKAFYRQNKNMHLTESYRSALVHVGIEYDDFASRFETPEALRNVRKDFEASSAMGVRGFPTLLLKHGDKVEVMANGYSTAEKMIGRIVAATTH